MIHALIFAGGTGTRMRTSDVPKQFIKVDGKEIIIRTLEHFANHSEVDTITVVCLKSWMDTMKTLIEQYHIPKVRAIIPGGKTGYESIHFGLLSICESASGEDIVLICDGVRPFLSKELIQNCIENTRQYGTAVPVTPSIDSVLVSEDGAVCNAHLDRKTVYITQAPQGYYLQTIMDAHKEAEARGMEDAISSADLMLELNREIHIFAGERTNIKATTPEDLYTLRSSYYYEHHLRLAEEEKNQQKD